MLKKEIAKFPSQRQDKFVVRLPDGLRDAVKAAAKDNGRSMNAEIIHRLDGGVCTPLPISEDEPAIDRQQDRYERLECCRLASEVLAGMPDDVLALARKLYAFLGEAASG